MGQPPQSINTRRIDPRGEGTLSGLGLTALFYQPCGDCSEPRVTLPHSPDAPAAQKQPALLQAPCLGQAQISSRALRGSGTRPGLPGADHPISGRMGWVWYPATASIPAPSALTNTALPPNTRASGCRREGKIQAAPGAGGFASGFCDEGSN